MAINLVTEYSKKVAERFKKSSVTAGHMNNDYSFEGVKTVNVYSVDTVPTGNYTRSGTSRYGTPTELGDTVQTLNMDLDRAFTYTIDKGNAKEQYNIKSARKSLRRQIDEVIVPEMDKHRLGVWATYAIHGATNAPTANTITGLVMDATEVLDEAFVPESGRTLFVTSKVYKVLKQNPDFLGIDKLGEKALAKGVVGEIDGMTVVKVPNSYLPTGIFFLVTHKSAIMGPAKLQDYKIHSDPPGINGDLVEGRYIHDAFVLEAKSGALYAATNSANTCNTPTVTNDATNSKFAITTDSNTTVYFTLDGSDPRFNPKRGTVANSVIAYSALTSGDIIKTVAVDVGNNKYYSNVSNAITYTA